MARVREIKTTFTAGEVSPDLLGRGDLAAYENGALRLRNVFIKPTGGVTRRPGMRYLDSLAGAGKMIPFEFNTQQTYLLVLTDKRLGIYQDGVEINALEAPWNTAQIPHIAWTQSADTLLIVSPDMEPQKLTRGAGGVWSLSPWVFFENDDGKIQQPYYKFAQSHVTIKSNGLADDVTLETSDDVFVDNHLNTRLRIGGVEALVTEVLSPTVVRASVIGELSTEDATIDWQEQAFSKVRGYPVTVAFHQDRLVLGGSRDLPNRLWFSKSGDLFNFDLGEGLDDEGIEFSILSDQVNAIRGIFSGRHLQVFTSGAEWMVTGNPLAPSSVQILRQTRNGSMVERHVPPINVDGATLYLSRSGDQVQEFLYTDLEQAYQSTDLALLSPHMIDNPIDMDYDPKRRLLFISRADGAFSALTIFRSEKVAAWTLHQTAGKVSSICAVGGDVYFMVEKNGVYSLQLLDDTMPFDFGLSGERDLDTTIWGGADHLNGLPVRVVADGVPQAEMLVQDGAIHLETGARSVAIGLPFTHEVAPLPPNAVGVAGGGRRVRLVEAMFRLQDTAALRLDTGQGLKDVALTRLGADSVFDAPPPRVSGDLAVRALGWQHDLTAPLWRVQQETAASFTLLSVTTQIKVND